MPLRNRIERFAIRRISDGVLLSIVAASIVLLTLAATIRLFSTGVELTLTTHSLSFVPAQRIDRDIDLQLAPGASIAAQDFTAIDASSLGCERVSAERGLRVEGNLRLAHLNAEPGKALELHLEDKGPLEIVLRGESTVAIGVGRDARVRRADGSPITCHLPESSEGRETIRLMLSGETRSANLQVWLGAIESVRLLREIRLSAIDFIEPDAEQAQERTPVFRSAIDEGTLRLLDVRKNISLTRGEPLRLETLHGRATDMVLTPGGLNLKLTGVASAIRIGPEGFTNNLQPTWLAYLMANDTSQVSGLWAAAAALLGLLWNVRKWARSQRS